MCTVLLPPDVNPIAVNIYHIITYHLTKQNWSVHFGWVKAYTGIEGNEVVDTLAKEAAQDKEDRNFVYDRIPISTIASSVKEQGLKKWQAQWKRAEKGAICRSFFSNCRAEAQITDSNNTGVHCYCQRPREDKSQFEKVRPNRQPHVPLQ